MAPPGSLFSSWLPLAPPGPWLLGSSWIPNKKETPRSVFQEIRIGQGWTYWEPETIHNHSWGPPGALGVS